MTKFKGLQVGDIARVVEYHGNASGSAETGTVFIISDLNVANFSPYPGDEADDLDFVVSSKTPGATRGVWGRYVEFVARPGTNLTGPDSISEEALAREADRKRAKRIDEVKKTLAEAFDRLISVDVDQFYYDEDLYVEGSLKEIASLVGEYRSEIEELR